MYIVFIHVAAGQNKTSRTASRLVRMLCKTEGKLFWQMANIRSHYYIEPLLILFKKILNLLFNGMVLYLWSTIIFLRNFK